MPPLVRMIAFMALLMLTCIACNSKRGKSFVPTINGYSDKDQQVFVLSEDLLEISGIAYTGNDELAAINDERGILFKLNLKTDSIESFKFEGKGDYEEVVKTDSGFYVLESNGDIIELKPPYTEPETYKFSIKGKVEFESMVWYKEVNKLVIIVKEQRKNKQGINAYSFDLNRKQFDPEPFFSITFKEIFIKLENYNAECKPSGAAINPINKKLYIIASIGKLMMECTAEGKLIKIYKLNPTHFPQPEGITFADNGDMYISNEGLEGKGTILKYPYVAQK